MVNILSKAAPKTGTVVRLIEQFEHEKAGNGAIRLPFKILDRLIGGGLRRGFTSVLSGPPSNGKSFMVYRLILHFWNEGIKFKYIPLEYNSSEHMRRIIGTHVGSWNMIGTDSEYADARIKAFTENSELLSDYESIESNICENPCSVDFDDDGNPIIPDVPYSSIIDLCSYYSKTNDIIFIDPITAIDPEKNGGAEYIQQTKFIRNINAIAETTNTHFMLIGHTRKRTKHNGRETNLTVDDVAGSVALSRFCQYLFLLDYHDAKNSKIQKSIGVRENVDHSRTMLLGKCNFGRGKGHKIAFDFKGNTPVMHELGWIIQDD